MKELHGQLVWDSGDPLPEFHQTDGPVIEQYERDEDRRRKTT